MAWATIGAGETTWRLVKMRPRSASTMNPVAVYAPNNNRWHIYIEERNIYYLSLSLSNLKFPYQNFEHGLPWWIQWLWSPFQGWVPKSVPCTAHWWPRWVLAMQPRPQQQQQQTQAPQVQSSNPLVTVVVVRSSHTTQVTWIDPETRKMALAQIVS